MIAVVFTTSSELKLIDLMKVQEVFLVIISFHRMNFSQLRHSVES